MDNAQQAMQRRRRAVLLGSVFVIATCGLVYELLAAALSSYLVGNSVTQFSIVIGVFMFAMGVGSYASRYVVRHALTTFVTLEIILGIVGGSAWVFLFAIFSAGQFFMPFLVLVTFTIGAMVGVEIPLMIRILKEKDGFKEMIASVMALDYVGALAASLLFPLVLLPYIGLVRTGFVFGLLNIIVAAIALYVLTDSIKGKRVLWTACGLGAALQILGIATAGGTTSLIEDSLYQDRIVIAEDSSYQRIVVTRWRDDIRLFLNGHLQFSSIDEARYHESLVHPVMLENPGAKRVLILGGGDGMTAREVLKYPSVEHVDLVDLDPAVTGLFRTHPMLTGINGNALNSPKVHLHHQDAMRFLQDHTESWQVVILDLPDPSSPSLARLYSQSFYRLVLKHLAQGGSVVTQATSPFYAPEAFWCVVQTLESAGKRALPEDIAADAPKLDVRPYHVNVPSFGEWGFVMARRKGLGATAAIPDSLPIPTRFLTSKSLATLFDFPIDISRREVEANRLDAPVVVQYYNRGWRQYND